MLGDTSMSVCVPKDVHGRGDQRIWGDQVITGGFLCPARRCVGAIIVPKAFFHKV